ncbi:helix-turn-helix transcriptional regulator [Flavilitoribacter nigricans]|uniref:HTH cro/C1-type domain-containing protein n=1 Tax=Flavilitoribacter nigricans (strain ATCC 23147 / DSM 23189 / NBRC 102662 / NCIMB 1420 / SS-2) TaxID=1122177 RepID=A0A2D0NBI3_FLAN2|nr:helix-turn-helix transcriptional regulator [Flavilitoribacter nigricans]PHN05871.1 hypothetical protein CRP01_15505 [Flavilitoribacter nigricans DSM 23189 = NBRC 102662]
MYLEQNIRFLRKSNGINQTDLGKRVGKSKEVISTYERGKIQPPIDVVFELSKVFQVSMEDLLMRDIETHGTSGTPPSEEERISDERIMQINKLLEQRVQTLEREIRRNNPDLADELGID